MSGTDGIPVLLVDDRPENLLALAAMLSEQRHDLDLVKAHSGNEALREVLRRPFALVLLDAQMPGMDGFEVAELMRLNPRTRRIPIIFLTAGLLDKGQHLFEGYASGAVDFLVKPVEPLALCNKVNVFCDLYAQRREIEAINLSLQAKVAELGAAMETLRQTHENLARSEAKAALGALVAGVAHEMNTALGNSMICANTLGDQASEFVRLVQDGALRRRQLDEFGTQLQHGTALMQRNLQRALDLMTGFQHMAADQVSEQRRSFDLRQVLSEVIAAMAPSLKRFSHRIELDVHEGLRMDSYPGPLEQVIINLVNNAYLHAFEGRDDGLLRIRAMPVEDAELGEALRLELIDNGKGMDEATLRRLFEPFFSTKIGSGGTGLGMAIVDHIVGKTLGGRIEVASTPGDGTRFTLHLPRRAPDGD